MVKKEATQAEAAAAEMGEKLKALEAARLQIEKQFGQGSIMKLGAHDPMKGIDVVPSGSILLDEALGVGGYPRGRVIEIYGPESSGKTTLALHAIAEAQKKGGIAAFIDAEHALDPVYAKNLGVNTDELWVSQPDSRRASSRYHGIAHTIGSGRHHRHRFRRGPHPSGRDRGRHGRRARRPPSPPHEPGPAQAHRHPLKSKTILVFINQIRMKIGVMFGNPETTTGGNALKFYASVRLEVRKIETIEKGRGRGSRKQGPRQGREE